LNVDEEVQPLRVLLTLNFDEEVQPLRVLLTLNVEEEVQPLRVLLTVQEDGPVGRGKYKPADIDRIISIQCIMQEGLL